MFASVLPWALLAASVVAAPAEYGIKFDKRAGAMPTLTLPYGTYQATSFNSDGDIYTFKNIRFGAPPVGDLRWAKPQAPAFNATLQDGSYGPICIQAPVKGLNLLGPGNESPIGAAVDQFLGGIPVPSFTAASEDCLFLDLYVPAKAINNPSLKLPVISWFYGGAFMFGGKDSFEPLLPLYDGTGMIQQSGGEVIFVASNYRVGAFGWLAGTTMEETALPNAGLYDQRAALQWIQDYISLVGGDPTQVTQHGESAGASSILHHLIAFGGTQDPLFRKAIIQSPAYLFMFDRKGGLEETFQSFANLSGCLGQGIACLRAASTATLTTANNNLALDAVDGTFPVGPAADGAWIRQMAPLELASGNFWKGLDSAIISHCSDEATLFVDGHIQTDAEFNDFIDSIFPPYAKAAGINALVEAQYPSPSAPGSPYNTETDRVTALVQDSSFTCNVRFLTDAYAGKTWNLQYSVTPGWHATDLLPTFYDADVSLSLFGLDVDIPLIPLFGGFSNGFQSYLTSFVRSGNPNTFRALFDLPFTIPWPQPSTSGNALGNVLDAGDLGFSIITDSQTTQDVCVFWQEIEAALTELGGYVPPGGLVSQTLVPVSGSVSANYTD